MKTIASIFLTFWIQAAFCLNFEHQIKTKFSFFDFGVMAPDTNGVGGYLKIIDPKITWVKKETWIEGRKSEGIRFNTDSLEALGKFYFELLVKHDRVSDQWYPSGRYYREHDGKLFEYLHASKQELMRYDMNFEVGDTFGPIRICGNCRPEFLKVYAIDTIHFLDNKLRKVIRLKCPVTQCYADWIEGIGELQELFPDYVTDAEIAHIYDPACVYYDDNEVFIDTNYKCWKEEIKPPLYCPIINFDLVWYVSHISSSSQNVQTTAFRFAPLARKYSNAFELLIQRSDGEKFWERTGDYLEEKDGFLYFTGKNQDRSFVIINMNLKLGEKIDLPTGQGIQSQKFKVIAIDSVSLEDPKARKRITLQCEEGNGRIIQWIEGIGSLENPFMLRKHCEISGDSSLVNCIEQGNEIIYKRNVNNTSCWITGTDNPAGSSEILIYPNPVKDQAQISFKNLDNSKVMVYDILGRSQTIKMSKIHENQYMLKCADWNPGVYILQIVNQNRIHASAKMIKVAE